MFNFVKKLKYHKIIHTKTNAITNWVSHKEVQVFDEDFFNIQNKIFLKNNFFNRIEKRST